VFKWRPLRLIRVLIWWFRHNGDALVTTSFLIPNFWGGLIIMAWPPELPASGILELLASRVVKVPFDGSAVVEGTVCPTTASSPNAVVRDILAVGLKRKNFKIKPSKSTNGVKYSISYLPAARSLWGAATLPHYRTRTLRVSHLGIHAWGGAMLPITLLPSCLFICITKARY
jgi:hypothetical protein